MPRTLQPTTPLARLILGCGKPAYVVAAEVPINHNRLLDYANGRVNITRPHLIRLAEYFEVTPAAILGAELPTSTHPDAHPDAGVDEDQPTVARAAFDEVVVRGSLAEVRATPGAKHVTARLTAGEDGWRLSDAPLAPLDVWAQKETTEWDGDEWVNVCGPWEPVCHATVEDVRCKPPTKQWGGNQANTYAVTLRVPTTESDALVTLHQTFDRGGMFPVVRLRFTPAVLEGNGAGKQPIAGRSH